VTVWDGRAFEEEKWTTTFLNALPRMEVTMSPTTPDSGVESMDPEHVQARFVGRLALTLAGLAILLALIVIFAAVTRGGA
jgi:hypothetical protein